MSDNNKNNNKGFDAWSIPKKPKPPSSTDASAPSMTMAMAIPKKKKPTSSSVPSPPNVHHMPVPRRSTVGESSSNGRSVSSSSAGPPKQRGYHDSTMLIPHHRTSSTGFGHGSSALSNSKRSTMDPTSTSTIPRKKVASSSSSSSMMVSSSSTITPSEHHNDMTAPLSLGSSSASKRYQSSVVSESPLIIRLSIQGVSLQHGIPRIRTLVRPEKRVRKNYKELDEDDALFLMNSSEDEQDSGTNKPKKKRSKLTKKVGSTSLGSVDAAVAAHGGGGGGVGEFGGGSASSTHPKAEPTADPVAALAPPSPVTLADDPNGTESPVQATVRTMTLDSTTTTSLDAPPPGTLNTLWYSRECFLHVLVVEKIIGWKMRHPTTLEWIPETLPPQDTGTETPLLPPAPSLDTADAAKWSQMVLTNPMIWSDPNKRMEVSRLVPKRCPIVAVVATAAQSQDGPRFRIKETTGNEQDREEVYLVKWRGRSHMHLSWERGSDIIKFDQSKNTARHKIRRFVQSQEIALGMEWKQVLEEERATNAAIHAHGEVPTAADAESVEEEYYPPANAEIERILACDESEMDMNLFAKQRGLNVKCEQERVREKEQGTVRKWNSQQGLADLLRERPWDPEDNVRYVIKWKGLPFSEITWEYWRDIKRDAVDEAEDFWIRQQPPSPERVDQLVNKQHPPIRDFRKQQESPVFGLSQRKRAVADMGQTMEDDDSPTHTGFKLRSYQLEGVNWLLFNWWNRRSCILADEMGLGKTIQSMCFLQSLQDMPTTDVRGPFLIVAPLSLIGQWKSEALSWAPDLNVVLYHGSADARDFLVKHDFYFTDQFVPKPTAVKLKKQHVTKFHILITTYEVVLKDVAVFQKIRWRALIVDEAHRLKNSKSRLFEDLGSVPRDFCLLLTGTPLANATEELWALLHFADKKAFADKELFLEKFGEMTDADQVGELHTILKPYLLRRVKEDVEKSLPPKEETILKVSLTPIQKKYYKAIYERNTQFLYKGTKPSNAPSLMNVMMELRKCCNHPYLVRGAEERIVADAASQLAAENESEENPIQIDHGKLFGDQLIRSSGKMVLIHKLLPKLFSNGHKVLIFSQMVRVLDLLEELLKLMKYKYERLDGTTSSSSRAAAVDRFCRASCQRFVMLLSTRAGGLGLNLTAADIVIIFDSDWNPQNDLQAMARAHRIGQTRAVRVYRLLTAKTYEMHMFHSASMKLGLERAVLAQQREQGEDGESGKSKSKSEKEAQAKEIDSLLKKGAYDVFKEDDDEEAQKFMETDIDQLLESNAQTVTYKNTGNNSSGGLGSFSKASFVTDTGDGGKDVDLDDPDFWKKTVGLEAPVETPEDVAQMLDDGVKRSRKQVQQFNPFEDYLKSEQAKEDKRLQKVKEEKEEKERLRLEKRMKKLTEKERRKKEKEEMRGSLFGESKAPVSKSKDEVKFKLKKKPMALPTSKNLPKEKLVVVKEKPVIEVKLTKPKKSGERKRAIRRAQYEDPEVERLKQGWDVPQRNRAVSACLRFGFDRFCKIRGEANLTSLPIQDIEVFFRSYFFQLCLQLVVVLLQMLKDEGSCVNEANVKGFLMQCLDSPDTKELDWLGDCVSNGMKYFLEIETHRRYFRLPMVLGEPSFVSDLRRGAALRALRRIFILCRIVRIIEDCLDELLAEIGYEQLARRGCPTNNLASLDVDLKARVVSTEELLLSISSKFKKVDLGAPAVWWDRSCDIALLIGTFVHGLGNYDAMVNDDGLPFAFNIKQFAKVDEACVGAQKLFSAGAKVTGEVFHQALEAAKFKDQLQIQAAVAAAAAASSEREKSALALREGGEAASNVDAKVHDTPADKLYDTKDDDSHFVTLRRLKKSISATVRSDITDADPENVSSHPVVVESNDSMEDKAGRRKGNWLQPLSMPDGRVLDHRLIKTLNEIERHMYPEENNSKMDFDVETKGTPLWPMTGEVSTNRAVKERISTLVLGPFVADELFEGAGIGLHGIQSGSSHRTLDDGSDYFIGSANHDLSQIAYGSDAPRFLRAIGVPMNLTRYAVSALVHADHDCVEALLRLEKEQRKPSKQPKAVSVITTGNAAAKNPSADQSNAMTLPDMTTSHENTMDKNTEGNTVTISMDPQNLPADSIRSGKSDNLSLPTVATNSSDADLGPSAIQSQATESATPRSDSNTLTDGGQVYGDQNSAPLMDFDKKEKVDTQHMGPTVNAVPVVESSEIDMPATHPASCSAGPEASSSNSKSCADAPSIKTEPSEGAPDALMQVKTDDQPDDVRSKPETHIDAVPPRSIPMPFQVNAELRASVCGALLYYGCPLQDGQGKEIANSLLGDASTSDEPLRPSWLFDSERFLEIIKKIAQGPTVIPSFDIIQDYISEWLLPHCLRLCLMGNGPTLENARGSKGEYETALGISLYPEPTENLQCVLPDPYLALEEHSVEAIASAYAILRRHRLMRSAMQLAMGDVVSVEMIDSVLRSPFMCKSMYGLPCWWCPWIHDAALLAHVASRGLFAILQDRHEVNHWTSATVFSQECIMRHLRTTFLSMDSSLAPPIVAHGSSEEISQWIEHHANIFPSARVLERRLAFLCSKVTEPFQDEYLRYDNLPMFDHGAWPRN